MNYPFEFDEIRLTDKMLDVLGFSEYWAGNSDTYGERTFGIEGEKLYWLGCTDESEDPCSGYCESAVYQAEYFHTAVMYDYKKYRDVYFLHDLYEDIATFAPELLEMFVEKTKEKGVNMHPYIQSYLKWKNEENKTEENK